MAYRDPEAGRAAIREHYRQNKAAYLERNKRVRHDIREMVRAAKDRPCADCGRSFPSYVMDLDHRPGEAKRFELGGIGRKTPSRPQVTAEIAKCDVVCANCHRVRTFSRAGHS